MSENKTKTLFSTEDAVKAIAALEGEQAVGLSQKDIRAVLRGFETVVADAISEGKKVQITGFFSANIVYRGARRGNNVATGEPMEVPASLGVSLKAGKRLKDAVSNLNVEDYKNS